MGGRLALSVDVDEWFHSRRWVDGQQALEVPDTTSFFHRAAGSDRPEGALVGPTRAILDLFDRHGCTCTFFVLGEIATWYPDLVREIAERGHEIACHGMVHVDMSVLGPSEFARQLERAATLLEGLCGQRPVGFRGPNLVYEPWATRILEEMGFVYDSTVCASRPVGGKYVGWANAPTHPYRPSYAAIAERGGASLVELPIPAFPIIKIAAGSGIMTRVIGLPWTLLTLMYEARRGDTTFYFHPWEVGPRPRPEGYRLRNALFLRRTGAWMLGAVERILKAFEGGVITARQAAARFETRKAARQR